MKKIIKTLFLSLSLIVAGCSNGENSQDKITIAYPDGVEAVAITSFAEVLLHEHGYTHVEKNFLEVGLLWASLSNGGIDLYLDAWLPVTQESYWQKYGNKLEKLGVLNPNGTSGLVVPSYVEIDSVTELNEHVDLFEGKIYGLGAGSGTNAKTLEMIEAYGLQFEQLNTSEAAMLAELRRSISQEKPVIITGWTPHYMWSKYDLKMLKDPKEIFPKERMEIIARGGFSADHPDIAKVMSRFQLTDDELNELINTIEAIDEHEAEMIGARQFYEKYRDKFDAWFEGIETPLKAENS